jgi:abequosyltransferase
MPEPLLTIAIPTYNRAKLLDKCLGAISSQMAAMDSGGKLEIIVCDNASTDNTSDIVNGYKSKGFAIEYLRNKENLGPDRNIARGFLTAKGKYVWLFADDDILLPGYLTLILQLLTDNDLGSIYVKGVWYKEEVPKVAYPVSLNHQIYDDPIQHITEVNYWTTFLTGNITNKSILNNVGDIPQYYDSFLVQISWVIPAIFSGLKTAVINDKAIACLADNTGGYKVIKVFAASFNQVLNSLVNKRLMPAKAKRIIQKLQLQLFFPSFTRKRKGFELENYLQVMLPVFWSYPTFWTKYVFKAQR